MLRSYSSTIESIRSQPTYQHAELLKRAWALPVAKTYAPLLSQSFTSICGPTSVANVLRSMKIESGRNPFKKFGVRPMSLEQIVSESAEILPAYCTVRSNRPDTLQSFRDMMRLSNNEKFRFIANFSRQWLFNHGGGHHSPIGGYLEDEDLVFVLDVNSGYGPWLVPAPRLHQAVSTADWVGGYTRGLACYERSL